MSFDFNFTSDQVQQILSHNPHYESWYAALAHVLDRYEVNTVPRVAAFIAQTAHESANYTALKENLNYNAASLNRIWPKRFPPDVAAAYAHDPEKIANRAYCDRMGNGSESSGDGWKFHGRGLIQLTGRDLYEKFATEIGKELDETVDYCETPDGAVESACFFWEHHRLNTVADAGNMEHMTKIINGGLLGIEDRTARFHHVLSVLRS
jgi:putative chitinase